MQGTSMQRLSNIVQVAWMRIWMYLLTRSASSCHQSSRPMADQPTRSRTKVHPRPHEHWHRQHLNNKTSEHITKQFKNSWLSRYPHPVQYIQLRRRVHCVDMNSTTIDDYQIIYQPTSTQSKIYNPMWSLKDCIKQGQTYCTHFHILVLHHRISMMQHQSLTQRSVLPPNWQEQQFTLLHGRPLPELLSIHRDMILDTYL